MEKNTAEALLNNLLERAEEGQAVNITSLERDALRVLLHDHRAARSSPSPEYDESAKFTAAANHEEMPLSIPDSDLPVIEDVVLCIDFGTSASKAFAVDDRSGLQELWDLILDEGKDDEGQYFLPSEILIDEETIHFGPEALARGDAERSISSPKQRLTGADDAAFLDRQKFSEKQDPHQIFSVRDILVLYLAYLNYLSEKALSNRLPSSEFKRRFTHPAWTVENREKNKEEMRLMMAEAIVLSRTLQGEFAAGLNIFKAEKALKAVRRVERRRLPHALVLGSVREATASGAGALLETRAGEREAYLVVDVGAGTTDVAGFFAVARGDRDEIKIWEVSDAADYMRTAGDALDHLLINLVRKKAGLIPGSVEEATLINNLKSRSRSLKEQLFNESIIEIITPTDEFVKVELSEFLEEQGVREFSERLRALVSKCAEAMGDNAGRIALILTGGGADLPMVRDLASRPLETPSGRQIKLAERAAMAQDLQVDYPDLIGLYPRLAVAIGGALPALPDERHLDNGGLQRDPGRRAFGPMYKN